MAILMKYADKVGVKCIVFFSFISSPGRSTGRAIAVTPASASASVSASASALASALLKC